MHDYMNSIAAVLAPLTYLLGVGNPFGECRECAREAWLQLLRIKQMGAILDASPLLPIGAALSCGV
jgi:hypothetical protein